MINKSKKIKDSKIKTILIVLITIVIVLAAIIYGFVHKETDEKTQVTDKKVLIAYFSRADENYNVGTIEVGNTEIIANHIKNYLGDIATTFKIEPVNEYPASYDECIEVAQKEKESNARPEFKNADTLNLSDYDTIFIGYPIWWEDVPMIINTFLEKYDFSGKNIYLFNTHEGSGNSGTYTNIKFKLSTANVNTEGFVIQGKEAREETSKDEVKKWLKQIGF